MTRIMSSRNLSIFSFLKNMLNIISFKLIIRFIYINQKILKINIENIYLYYHKLVLHVIKSITLI